MTLRLAISNIAWEARDEALVADALVAQGIRGIEIAPTRRWPHPTEVTGDEVRRYREFWEERGIAVVALQALLFGREDLRIFASPEARAETLAYLTAIIRLSVALGARRLVFGSPRNRQVGDLPSAEIDRIALPFFRTIGEVAAQNGAVLCIEPNPRAYGCDYLTTSEECLRLLDMVGSPGLGLQLDSGGATLAAETPAAAILRGRDWIRHVHISEPHLVPPCFGGVDHMAFASALAAARYGEWLSVEMRPRPDIPAVEAAIQAIDCARAMYGQVGRAADSGAAP